MENWSQYSPEQHEQRFVDTYARSLVGEFSKENPNHISEHAQMAIEIAQCMDLEQVRSKVDLLWYAAEVARTMRLDIWFDRTMPIHPQDQAILTAAVAIVDPSYFGNDSEGVDPSVY